MPALIDERALSKLRWRCRRGLLENDLFIERFFARHEATLTEQQAQGLRRSDGPGRQRPAGPAAAAHASPRASSLRDDVREVLGMLRAAVGRTPGPLDPLMDQVNDPLARNRP